MFLKSDKKGRVLLIVLAVLIIVSLTGYICYDKFFKNNNDSINDKKESQEKTNKDNNNDIEELDDSDKLMGVALNSAIVKDAIKKYNGMYISSENLYKNGLYDISNITNYDLIATALMNIDSNYIAYCIAEDTKLKDEISFQKLTSILDKYVVNMKITKDTFNAIEEVVSYPLAQYEVNNLGIILTDSGIKLIGPCGFEGPEPYINRKIVKAEKKGNLLYIYEKHAFAKYDGENENGTLLVNYYKDYDRIELVETGLEDMYSKNVANNTPNWNLYNTYKYTFEIIDNDYYFKSFELSN